MAVYQMKSDWPIFK